MPLSTTGKILNGIIIANAVASFVESYNKPARAKPQARGEVGQSLDGDTPPKPLTAREKRVEAARWQWKIDHGYVSLDEDYEPVFNTGCRDTNHEHWCIYWGLKEPPMPPEPPGAWERVKRVFWE